MRGSSPVSDRPVRTVHGYARRRLVSTNGSDATLLPSLAAYSRIRHSGGHPAKEGIWDGTNLLHASPYALLRA